MKTILKLICAILFFSTFGVSNSFGQDLSLAEQQELVRNDADYKLFIGYLKKFRELTISNYFGDFKLTPAPTKPPVTKEEMVEYLRQSGIQRPEEFIQLTNDLTSSMARAVKNHDFLAKKSPAELKAFMRTLIEQYPDADLNPEFILNRIKPGNKG